MFSGAAWAGRILAIVLALVAPLFALDVWLRTHLFDHSLYSNSDALDRTLRDFTKRDDWRVVILGDSEARWGFDPRAIELELARRGIVAPTFNFAVDGFSGGWGPRVAEELRIFDRANGSRIAILGVQMVEVPEIVTHDNVCNAAHSQGPGFQETVFRSSFARDWGVARACSDGSLQSRVILAAEDSHAAIRYREVLRALLLGESSRHQHGLADSALPISFNGYQPHVPASRNGSYQIDLDRALADRTDGSSAYAPLPVNAWDFALGPGGFFETTAAQFADKQILLVLTPLPTNPMLIDLKQRRDAYERHRERLRTFAVQRAGVVYIDMPIRDDLVLPLDYTDHRHLSSIGAARYSADLGEALAANPEVLAALR